MMMQDMITLRDALPESQVLVLEPYWPSTIEEPPKGQRLFDLHGERADQAGLPFIKGQRGVSGRTTCHICFPKRASSTPTTKDTLS